MHTYNIFVLWRNKTNIHVWIFSGAKGDGCFSKLKLNHGYKNPLIIHNIAQHIYFC